MPFRMAQRKTRAKKQAPWERAAPEKSSRTHLSPRNKAAAEARALRAGRRYPNLVDNMRAAKK
jgi:hypothetical protein